MPRLAYMKLLLCMQARVGRWFHSSECSMADACMARLAASGLMPVGGADASPMAPEFAWQVIRGAAVSSPKVRDSA